jgi:hypothetical protein
MAGREKERRKESEAIRTAGKVARPREEEYWMRQSPDVGLAVALHERRQRRNARNACTGGKRILVLRNLLICCTAV